MDNEEWKIITGFERYSVSSFGNIKFNKTGNILNLRSTRNKRYINAYVRGDGNAYTRNVHVLVALMFIGVRPKDMVIDHIDRNRSNNRADNLQYVTISKNGRNRNSNIGSSSRFRGVSFFKRDKTWEAVIQNSEKRKKEFLGRFTNEVDAAMAYNKRALELGYEPHEVNIF